jgi:hypothetical protein
VTDAGAKDTAQIIKKGELAFAFFVLALRLGLANHVLQPFSLWARCTEIARLCESAMPYHSIANDIELNHGFNTRGNCGRGKHPWREDGPLLRVEFARESGRRRTPRNTREPHVDAAGPMCEALRADYAAMARMIFGAVRRWMRFLPSLNG